MEWGSVSQPAAWSFGTTYFRHVSASVIAQGALDGLVAEKDTVATETCKPVPPMMKSLGIMCRGGRDCSKKDWGYCRAGTARRRRRPSPLLSKLARMCRRNARFRWHFSRREAVSQFGQQ